jgi:mannan endo-1,4-beta-mannosidase
MRNVFRTTKKVFAAACASLVCSCASAPNAPFVTQHNGQFEVNGAPYYYIGTNFWYGAILGSTGQGGNRERLLKELDFMKDNGINNLRVLVGADGRDVQDVKVRPALQVAPGVYNDTIFDGLDYLLAEMAKRDMYAVLYLNNSWEWSGGYAQYLDWTGYGTIPPEGVRDWTTYLTEVSKYATCDSCHALFLNHVRHVITRTNRYTGKPYTDDPAIMSWQVGNEPRVFSNDGKPAFTKWLKETTALIRALDGNHLIAIGSEGQAGCENDMQLFETIHADPNVDYLTIHIWPKNWSWIEIPHVTKHVAAAIEKTNAYIEAHTAIARKLNKPVVIEEFGYPRDHHRYTLDDPTTARDAYYNNIFAQVAASAEAGGALAGCNFWAWGGFGRAAHEYWQPWDDYLGDPAQEEQGLNAVFDTDSTIGLIKTYAHRLK